MIQKKGYGKDNGRDRHNEKDQSCYKCSNLIPIAIHWESTGKLCCTKFTMSFVEIYFKNWNRVFQFVYNTQLEICKSNYPDLLGQIWQINSWTDKRQIYLSHSSTELKAQKTEIQTEFKHCLVVDGIKSILIAKNPFLQLSVF